MAAISGSSRWWNHATNYLHRSSRRSQSTGRGTAAPGGGAPDRRSARLFTATGMCSPCRLVVGTFTVAATLARRTSGKQSQHQSNHRSRRPLWVRALRQHGQLITFKPGSITSGSIDRRFPAAGRWTTSSTTRLAGGYCIGSLTNKRGPFPLDAPLLPVPQSREKAAQRRSHRATEGWL